MSVDLVLAAAIHGAGFVIRPCPRGRSGGFSTGPSKRSWLATRLQAPLASWWTRWPLSRPLFADSWHHQMMVLALASVLVLLTMLMMPVLAKAMLWVPFWLSILVLVMLDLAEVPLRALDLPSIPSIPVMLVLALVLRCASDLPSIPTLARQILAQVLLMKGRAPSNARLTSGAIVSCMTAVMTLL